MQRIIGKNKKGKNITFAIVDSAKWDRNYSPEGTVWYSNPQDDIQVSQMRWDKGKRFLTHKHKPYPRVANLTQECMMVFKGKLGYKIWDDEKILLAQGELGGGDLIVIYGGWHEFEVLEDDTIAIETKNGPYSSVELDKEYSG